MHSLIKYTTTLINLKLLTYISTKALKKKKRIPNNKHDKAFYITKLQN